MQLACTSQNFHEHNCGQLKNVQISEGSLHIISNIICPQNRVQNTLVDLTADTLKFVIINMRNLEKILLFRYLQLKLSDRLAATSIFLE